ncbi:hypothetical protein Cgig2_017892 [Carnegiea gigantea]|uniref:Uncharacterized protein n=1 Tax=Carnegiea gigantea TaxID=171969 RepID=A0A9Q1GYI4_9CARY|nr:hypothetical protein Cgig2_017892 [Carnegiea gigantea]
MSSGIQITAQEVAIDQELNSIIEPNNETVPDANVVSEIEQIRATSPPLNNEVLQISNIISSYAAMADPDGGKSLNFVHSQIVNGVKCAKIEPQDVQSEIEYWNSAVLCSVLGANPPLEVIEGDRMEGTEVQLHEIKSFSDCITTCELQKLRNNGPYYTWTNKTIWTRIDTVFVNIYWYNAFDICQLTYMANSLSDHTAMVLNFPWCPKPKPSFQFYDMWIRDPSFLPLMTLLKAQLVSTDPITKLKRFLKTAKIALQKLNKNKYVVIDIIKQQSKAEWIGYGDDSTRYFFAKIKKRKTDTYILSIQDDQGHTRQGFTEVKEVMQAYYQSLLGK